MEVEREIPLKLFALVIQDGGVIEVQIRVRTGHHDVPLSTKRVPGLMHLWQPEKLETLVVDMLRAMFDSSC